MWCKYMRSLVLSTAALGMLASLLAAAENQPTLTTLSESTQFEKSVATGAKDNDAAQSPNPAASAPSIAKGG